MATTTNLELCQQLVLDAGITGIFTTVINQTDEFQRVVSWIDRAVQEIEGSWLNWNFLHNFGSFSTVISQSDYTPAQMNATALSFADNRTFQVPADEIRLFFRPWTRQKLNPTALVAGDPYEFTILPSKSIRFYDTPISIQTIDFEWWQKPTLMTLDASEPAIPTQYRYIIVAKALMYYAEYESSDEADYSGTRRYTPLLEQLESSELPAHQGSGSINTGTDIEVSVPYQDSSSTGFGFEY